MFESKYSNLLTILLIVGIILIVATLGTTGFIMVRNGTQKQEAEEAVNNFQNNLNEILENTQGENTQLDNTIINNIAPIITPENVTIDNNISSENNNNNTYKGFIMVGTIEIPTINLKYPVLEDASKAAMEEAVGIYDGPGLNKVGNTTIAGHNYRDGRFFSNNKKLKEGDKIQITDTTGKKITYEIYKIYTTTPEDSSYLDRDTAGKREISLTTCTDDSQSRLIIWAKER